MVTGQWHSRTTNRYDGAYTTKTSDQDDKHGRVTKMILHGRVSTMMVHGRTTTMMVTGCHNIYYHLCIAGSHIVIDLLSFVNHAFVMTVTGSRNVYWQSWVTFRYNANLWS